MAEASQAPKSSTEGNTSTTTTSTISSTTDTSPYLRERRQSWVAELTQTTFAPQTPAEDHSPFEKAVNELVSTELTYVGICFVLLRERERRERTSQKCENFAFSESC